MHSLLLVVTTLAGSISMGPLAFIGGSIPILWAISSSASSYPSDWRTKRLCSTRGQKTGLSVRGAKQRPSSLPAFFQSISILEICAISFCITEEKSEMPEISCMAFFLFLYLSKQVVLLFDFANPQVVSAEIPQSWWGSYGFTVLVVLAFWISGFSTESNGTYGGSTWGSADMAVFPWDHPDLLTTPLAAWATDTRHLNSTRMLVHVARLSILFPSTNRHCDGYVMKWYRQKSMREVEWKKNKLTWSNVRCVSWVW